MSKTILIATGLYPPDIGGPATYTKMLETELPKAGITPEVLPFGTVRHFPKIIRHVVYARRLWRRAKETNADAIYALDPISVGLPALCVARLLRKPFIIRLGGDYAWEQGRVRFGETRTLDEYTADATAARSLPVRILAFLQTFVTKRAVKVIAPSRYLKTIIASWGVPEHNIMVVYSALFPLPVQGARTHIRTQLQYTYPTIVSAARLTPWKGMDALLDMIDMLRVHYPDLTLVIAGDGEAKASLEEKVEVAGLTDHVRFVGRLSKDALGAMIKGADVFVYNTNYEGLPHQLLEVMDLGVPIVTTSIAGNRELITDGVEGLLVRPNDVPALLTATQRILQNPSLAARLTQNARKRSHAFAQETVTTNLVTELLDII